MYAKRLTYDVWLIRSVLFHYIQPHNLPVSTGGLIGLDIIGVITWPVISTCKIIEAIPHRTYIEPFIGMGGIFFTRKLISFEVKKTLYIKTNNINILSAVILYEST